MSAAELLRSTRERHGISQRRLALRAGTGQAAISRIERGDVSPTTETLQRLLAAMGEELFFGARPLERDYDPQHMRATLARPAADRMQLAMSWNKLAGRLNEAGRRARER